MFKLFSKPKQSDNSPSQGDTPEAPQSGTLTQALSQTGKALVGKLLSLGRADQTTLSEDLLEEMEETLIRADLGVDLAVEIVDQVRKSPQVHQKDQLEPFLRSIFTSLLDLGNAQNTLQFKAGCLNVYLVVGVNGAGKTTLIGKLAHRFKQQGQKVIIGAGDTFRAAAEDQLAIWAQRADVTLIRKDGGDSAAVIFDAIQAAKSQQADILILDTAGRLQNKHNLMEELHKIKNIMTRELPTDSVQEYLLVIDATTGQNALQQAKIFHEAITLTGVALTKLDGSAKGGIVFNIAKQLKLPVKLVGVGEKITDLQDFEPKTFINALFEAS